MTRMLAALFGLLWLSSPALAVESPRALDVSGPRALDISGVCAVHHGPLIEAGYCGKFSQPNTGGGGTGGVPLATCSFYLAATGGSDSNSGTTSSAPFATAAHMQSVLQGQTVTHKVACLKAGSGGAYNGFSVTLGSADANETWQADPASGVNTAVLDGQTSTAIAFNSQTGAPNVTINGLKFQNYTQWTIIAYNSPGTVITNNDIGSMTVAPPVENASAVVGINVGDHVTVSHNYLHDLASAAIADLGAYDAANPGKAEGTVIDSNVVSRTVQKSSDNGAIYINMHSTGVNGGHLSITNNYVVDVGSGGSGFNGMHDVYLDDNASNVTVSGNILGPPALGIPTNGGDDGTIFIHNGANNTVTDNILDLGSSSFVNPVTYGWDSGSISGMSGNTFTNNLVLSNYVGGENYDNGFGNFAFLQAPGSSQPSWFTVGPDLYFNYASGGQVFSNGNLKNDSNPVNVNPQVSGYLYTMANASPALGPPINFVRPAGNWGPIGFTVPTTSNHSNP